MLPDQIERGMLVNYPLLRADETTRFGNCVAWCIPASMDPTNAEIADRLALFAALLELADANPFARRAYVRASEIVRSSPASVAELVRTGRVRELRGIGGGIEAKLRELVETGEIAELRALEEEVEPELVAYGRSLGVSVGRMLEIARSLEIRNSEAFVEAAARGHLRDVPGIGAATEAKILAALAEGPRAPRGLTLGRSLPLSHAIAVALGGTIAGSARRYAELVFELAVVCGADDPRPILDRFEALPMIVAPLEREGRRAVGLTIEGVPVSVTVAAPAELGTELFRATGSAEYVAALEPLPSAADEESLFVQLGLAWCPPELRELPDAAAPASLIERERIRGDLHCHTTWSDGRASVREMALAARARGYEYLAVCDHTPNVGVVRGLTSDDLRRQGEEIEEVNAGLAPFRVLRGIECDIRADGSLDVEDALLAELEWVQLSLHAGQRRPARELTRIVTHAMRNPAVRALSHPTGRILNHRPENAVDLATVFEVAIQTGVALEINGLPDRIDLSAAHAREALAAGVKLVLNSDAHSEQGLERLDLALATARKGGAPVEAVVNARPATDVVGR